MVLPQIPTKQVLHMNCARDHNQMTGGTAIERMDAEHVKGNTVVKSEREHAVNMKSNFETKFLSSGDMKPLLLK